MAIHLFLYISLASSDYSSTTRQLSFGPSTSQFDVAIPITDDDISEALEQFFGRLVLADQGTDIDVVLNPNLTTIDIRDNDRELIDTL